MTTPTTTSSSRAPQPGTGLDDELLDRFRGLIQRETGIALARHKRALLEGRLNSRLAELGLPSFQAYWERVTQHPEEVRELVNAVTTNKTSFFREPHHFEALREQALQARRPGGGRPRLRIWSAASSTGEEAYSMAITVLEALGEGCDLLILATDIDTEVLEAGSRGVFPAERLEDVPEKQADRWFVRGTGPAHGQVRVRQALRRVVRFRQLNLIAPPWPIKARFDAVWCRNCLIYFDAPTQDATVRALLRHVAPGGELVLGHSESVIGMRTGLKLVGRTRFAPPEGAAA